MNQSIYYVACRNIETSSNRPYLLRTVYPEDTVLEGRTITAKQRKGFVQNAPVTRQLTFEIPASVSLEVDKDFITDIVFQSGKKYAGATVKIIRSRKEGSQYIRFSICPKFI